MNIAKAAKLLKLSEQAVTALVVKPNSPLEATKVPIKEGGKAMRWEITDSSVRALKDSRATSGKGKRGRKKAAKKKTASKRSAQPDALISDGSMRSLLVQRAQQLISEMNYDEVQAALGSS